VDLGLAHGIVMWPFESVVSRVSLRHYLGHYLAHSNHIAMTPLSSDQVIRQI